jgi:hypothetical protein
MLVNYKKGFVLTINHTLLCNINEVQMGITYMVIPMT